MASRGVIRRRRVHQHDASDAGASLPRETQAQGRVSAEHQQRCHTRILAQQTVEQVTGTVFFDEEVVGLAMARQIRQQHPAKLP